MTDYNAKNERIKKAYLHLLKEADQKADATIDGVRKALHRFEEYTDFADFARFDKGQAVGFKKHLATCKAERSGQPLSRATVYSTVNILQEFMRWLAREHGYRSKIDATDIRFLNLSRKDISIARSAKTKKVPTSEQIRAVLEAMPSNTEIERRNRALIAGAFVTGMRDGALASLRLKHVDLERELVIQDPAEVNTKFSKRIETFFFPVGANIEQIFIDWVTFLRTEKLYGHDDPVFPKTRVAANAQMSFEAQGIEPHFWSTAAPICKILKQAFEGAGLPYFTPHSFRSTLAILGEQVCQTPEDFKAWSQNLGHDSPLTTFASYGQVPTHRQGELVRKAGQSNVQDRDDKIDKMIAMMEQMASEKEARFDRERMNNP